MLITQLPPEILTYICEYLPLQDVKNVSQILPEIYLSSVFKNWSNLQNTLNYIQEQIRVKFLNMTNTANELNDRMRAHIKDQITELKKSFMEQLNLVQKN